MSIPYLACMLTVSTAFGLPPRVLPAIQAVEGGKPGMESVNKNDSKDLGVMQINTLWVPVFSAKIGMKPEEIYKNLVEKPCFNIAIAGAIMKIYIDEAKGDIIKAIGYYHSHTPALSAQYQLRVARAAARLFAAIAPASSPSPSPSPSPSSSPAMVAAR
ncbi:lytic transglycosylase domain-containing protein [Rhodovastum atsumiense]|uniref:Lytic transglycosylase domain-containing protein n=1 Tax=Rhodovastum atsumiense TaxID=504468 RepID=A0A5M6IX08_9PROT|nr:lytic transglycosylase domain-containing protein [Rhodovastum atsumiense]KAA5612781.1 lytic transglycosylase domain-containing protein [Rhodovastum atsumiense]